MYVCMYACVSVCVYIYINVYIYIYLFIYRERESKRTIMCMYILYIYIYIHTCLYRDMYSIYFPAHAFATDLISLHWVGSSGVVQMRRCLEGSAFWSHAVRRI